MQWSYEETKMLLAIISNSQFHETLQTRQQSSQIYKAVAKRLQQQGCLWTPEQCCTKFKSSWSGYRQVRRGHVPEPCIFYEEMDALSSSSSPSVAIDPTPDQEGSDMGSGELSQQNGAPTQTGEVATVDDAARDEKDIMYPGQEVREVDLPVLFPNRLGFESGMGLKKRIQNGMIQKKKRTSLYRESLVENFFGTLSSKQAGRVSQCQEDNIDILRGRVREESNPRRV